jgi:predicted permease
MRNLRAIWFRLAALFHKDRRDSELADELASHIQLHTDDNIRRGMDPATARRNALMRLGGLEAAKERYRDRSTIPFLESLIQDLKYAGRMLRRSPAFTITALSSLALGIGANSAIFAFANAALWRPLPVAHPESLVFAWAIREDGNERFYPPAQLADELAQSTGVFSGAATRTDDGLSFSFEGSRAERIMGEVVSPNYFVLLGVKPALGQGFSEDVRLGRWAPEVVLSHRFWTRRFAGNPGILGRTILLNNYPFTVVGIAPPGFFGVVTGWDPELRLPLMPAGESLSQMNLASSNTAQIVARLQPGVSIAQAESAADASFERFLNKNQNAQLSSNPMRHIIVRPGNKGWKGDVSDFRQPLLILLALGGLVLLIACGNLANMLLARSTARRSELAVRAAIGAGRLRLVRQMLIESLLLSGLAGALGIALSAWASRILVGFLPQGHIALSLDVDPDARVIWFTAGLSLLASVILGLVPGLRATRGNLAMSLRSESGGSAGATGGSTLRSTLVIGQIAFSVLLLAMAGLFLRALGSLHGGDLFPQANRVLLVTIKPQPELYSPDRVLSLTAEITRSISALPCVQSAALAENGPLGSRSEHRVIQYPSGPAVDAGTDGVSPGYFDTIGQPLIDGRDFSFADTPASPPVVIINETLARLLFNDENPLGRRVLVQDGAHKPREVVGIVRTSHYYDLHAAPPPVFYTDIQQDPAYMPTLHLRMRPGYTTSSVIGMVRTEFDAIDKGFPIFNVRTLEDRVNDSLAQERLLSELAGSFGLLAVVLAVVGIYAVMSYSVARRAREIGLRSALGATRDKILRMVLRESMGLVILGIAAGVPTTLAAQLLVSSRLPGTGVIDLTALGVAAFLMLIIAALAAFVPARRAATLDPIAVLRIE